MFSTDYVWAKVINYLEEQLSAITVSAWFDDAQVIELNEEQLILYTPSDFRRDIIRNRCTAHIQDALKLIFNSNAKVVVFDTKQLDAYRNKGSKNSARILSKAITTPDAVWLRPNLLVRVIAIVTS